MAQHATYPDLSSKVVLITGIGQNGDPSMWGNGAATARVFLRNGARVFGCDINLPSANATRNRLLTEFPGAEIEVVQTDVTKKDRVELLVKSCLAKWGRVDVLINNVGKSEKGDPGSMSEEVWDSQVAVNLKSVYLTCHSVLPIMEKQGSGVVINVSSIGVSSIPFFSSSEDFQMEV
jgi:NAD(P)-dependent dehydrogenase (short-subunit alcohol dehydrogenase family)